MPHQLGEQSSEDKVAALVDDPETVHGGTNLRQPYEGGASSDGEDSYDDAWYDNDVHHDLREQHERNLSNGGGGVRYSARCASDKNAHDSIPCYLRGKLEEGEAVALVDGTGITHNEINLVEECDTSIGGEDWSDNDMQNGMVQIT